MNETPAAPIDNNNFKVILDKDENLNTINIDNLNNNIDNCNNKLKSNLVSSASNSNANANSLNNSSNPNASSTNQANKDTVFTLKKWNLVAMWSWDVECEVCAICRTPLMGTLLF